MTPEQSKDLKIGSRVCFNGVRSDGGTVTASQARPHLSKAVSIGVCLTNNRGAGLITATRWRHSEKPYLPATLAACKRDRANLGHADRRA